MIYSKLFANASHVQRSPAHLCSHAAPPSIIGISVAVRNLLHSGYEHRLAASSRNLPPSAMAADAHPPPPSPAFTVAMIEAALIAIAVYHVIELHFLLFTVFLRRRSFYFWIVLAATWGVALNGIGTLFNVFILNPKSTSAQVNLVTTVVVIGWYLMVTGQSLVLFSRLHLVVQNTKLIRGVLYMIIFTVLTLHVPVTVISYLKVNDKTGKYARIFDIYEPIQLNVFTVQELIISGIYIYHAFKMLQPIQNIRGKRVRVTIRNLIYINTFIILLDIAVASLEYAHFDNLQHFFKAFVYSIKLKIEFIVLNQLLELMQKQNYAQSTHRLDHIHYTANDKSLVEMEMTAKNDVALSSLRKNERITTAVDEHGEIHNANDGFQEHNTITTTPLPRSSQSSSQAPFADKGS